MGPCRIDPFGEGADRGICGATADIIVARNLLRTIAAGAAAHSDHARDAVLTFKKMSEGEAGSYRIKDETKLLSLASEYGIPAEGKSHEGSCSQTSRCPASGIWKTGRTSPVHQEGSRTKAQTLDRAWNRAQGN